MFATIIFITFFLYLATGTVKNIIQSWKLLSDEEEKETKSKKLVD